MCKLRFYIILYQCDYSLLKRALQLPIIPSNNPDIIIMTIENTERAIENTERFGSDKPIGEIENKISFIPTESKKYIKIEFKKNKIIIDKRDPKSP